MREDYFIDREACPGCLSICNNELYSNSFLEPPIRNYLEEFYGSQGGVEFDYLKGANYILQECNDCSLIYQRFILNNFLMTKLYDEWINPDKVFNIKVDNRNGTYYERLAREVKMTIRHFGVKPSQLEYLDFGMGWGEWCCMAKAYGCSVFGTELSQTRIDYAKASDITVINWEGIPKYRFDLINAEQVFEHIPDPGETFKYLSDSLQPKGIICCTRRRQLQISPFLVSHSKEPFRLGYRSHAQ